VVGKLRLNEWTIPDGERRSRIQVVAAAVGFLGPPTVKASSADEKPDAESARRSGDTYRRQAG